ncbi:ABC transporter permease [Sphingosinicella sp. CPCC 101087]|uniref:ABC transporter permease n=1 Tax=Sphingosinicella sp. CPCC 101087 TaxID=2497754 RepID=UPI00101D88E2|nr:ABC transporter permease [Sphingosinicella sp. CPCC 101087]
MWRNYLTVGLRSLLRSRTYAFINIFGLAVGLAACLMLLLYVRYERSYDEWLPNAENLYQLQNISTDDETGEVYRMQMSQYAAGTALEQDFPEVERRLFMYGTFAIALKDGEAISIENAAAAAGPVFDVLPLPFVRGDPATALARPGNVVLTETVAQRLFGDEDPIGRTLTLVQREHVDHRVTGVIRDLPPNSHMRLSMIYRIDPATTFATFPEFLTSWGQISGWNYLRLRPGTDVERIHAAMPQWERRNIPPEDFGRGTIDRGKAQDWRLVNVRDVHLGEAQLGGFAPGNDERTIVTFTVVAFLILFMACVNFTNLATARASQRAREVALRKVLGANRRQLIAQFLGESLLLTTIAMLIALAAAELLLPFLSGFLEADLEMTYFGADGLVLPIVLLVLLVGAVGGLYPAFQLSRFQPAEVLKANKSAAEAAGTGRLRSALVVAQFAVSIGLIICTAIVYAQTVHARTADPGFRREGILQIDNLNRRQLQPVAETLAREIGRIDGVVSVSRTSIGVDTHNTMGRAVYLPGRDEPVNLGNYAVDEHFFATMGIDRLAGRLFDPDRPMDRLHVPVDGDAEAERALARRGGNVIVNALAARQLGFRTPEDAVGKQVRVSLSPFNPEIGLTPVTIVGVVRDTRWRSIRLPVEPIMYRLGSDYAGYLAVRYDSADPGAVREHIGEVWRRVVPDVPFEAYFTEEILARLYGPEAARAQVFAGFALLAIIVACLGLFGLAAFTAERRTKEIGIRKVLGARTGDIVRLLAWQFSKPIILANLIAWPVAWWAMRDWLNTFEARIDLGPAPFLLAGLLALAIALGTIAGHAVRVARANPIHALRYE